MMITVVEYARRHGKNPNYIRNRCVAGKFASATRIDGTWMIDESEPFPPIDNRLRSGRYVGWRIKYGGNKRDD